MKKASRFSTRPKFTVHITNEELAGEALGRFATRSRSPRNLASTNENGGVLNSQPKHIRRVVEESLKRLRTDRIDLYYQHRVDPTCTNRRCSSCSQRADQRRKGLALRLVRSECENHPPGARRPTCYSDPDGIFADAKKTRRRTVCSLRVTSYESASSHGPGRTRVPYPENKCPHEVRPENGHAIWLPPLFSENIAANMPIIDWIGRFAEKKHLTPAQISLAWLLAQKPFIVPIPGTRNVDHLNENIGAINVQLTRADLREIDSAVSKIKVLGGRMNEEQMRLVDQTA